ncbi:MAG: patatin-like phospholipase family protein [Desulfobacteraceae bacterium]|nr:MAG: patatin-like phospholipase family protein [Desulfobacteraceae bacterium]
MNEKDGRKGLPEKIALCLSGGGYRAAGFHLGTFDYLEHLGLLSKVSILSTVSGGTFVGIPFAVSLVEKDPFSKLFNDCYKFIRDQRYMENILQFLGTERPDRPGCRRNMIQAAAELYANSFLRDSRTGKPYLFETLLDSDVPLTAIFNATSFYSGESFVFQKGEKGASFAGSFQGHLPKEKIGSIRLGDIAAASSCFPGGFEPLAFPQDFVWEKAPSLAECRTPLSVRMPETIPLMDGGVADNVGLTTALLAIESGEDDPDLIIASDVDRKPIDLYPDFPLKPNGPSFIQKLSRIGMTIQSLHFWLIAVVVFLASAMIGEGIYTWRQFEREGFRWLPLFFYLVALMLSIGVGGGILFVCRLFRQGLLGWFDEKMGGEKGRSWKIFKKLTLGHAANMVKVRISSIFAMTSNIFMNCIRELAYVVTKFNPDYNYRFVEDTIYRVREKMGSDFFDNVLTPPQDERIPGRKYPSEKLLSVVDAIMNMDSTLWWQKEYQLPCLVACGQISLCVSMYDRYFELGRRDPEIQELLNRLAEDWKLLNENPYHFLEERYPDLGPFPLPPKGTR